MKLNNIKREYIWSAIFHLPGFLFFITFLAVPILFSIYISFFRWNLIRPMKFIGFSNYIKLFSDDPKMGQVFLNTLIYVLEVVPFSVFIALVIAVLLSKIKFLRTFYQSIYFLPMISSNVAIALVWRWIFSTKYGFVNAILDFILKDNINWLGDPRFALLSVSIIVIWKTIPLNIILYIAAVRDIPQEFYESARIDGANEFKLFRYITIPSVSPTTFFVLILTIVTSFFNGFDVIRVLTQGGPVDSTNIYVNYLYEKAFLDQRFGYGNTISVVFFIFILIFTIWQFRLQRRWVHY